MKQAKIIIAYEVSDKLAEQDNLTNEGKWTLFMLRKDLSPSYEFNQTRYVEILNKHKGIINGDSIKFETPEIAAEFAKEINDLGEMDTSLDIKKQELSFNDIPNLTVHDIEALEDFIEFKK